MTAPIVLNGRAAARVEITGVQRTAREIVGRLHGRWPDRYRVIAPDPKLGRLRRHLWEQTELLAAARRLRSPLIYCPGNAAPLAWPGNVVVLHDAGTWRTRESFSRAYVATHVVLESMLARRALQVVTVSEFSRAELIEIHHLAPERVAVIPNGVGEEFAETVDPEPVRARYGLSRPYVLAVAAARPHKNVQLLGPLAQRLAEAGVDVVWAGGAGEVAVDVGASVRRLGYVPDADLPGLYAGASVFVMPSRYEGFGIPCLEAMASGVPVVAANRSALPEVCGDAALLIDPDDPAELGDAVERVLGDGRLAARLRAGGRARAAVFSWDRAAELTHALLTELSAGRG